MMQQEQDLSTLEKVILIPYLPWDLFKNRLILWLEIYFYIVNAEKVMNVIYEPLTENPDCSRFCTHDQILISDMNTSLNLCLEK